MQLWRLRVLRGGGLREYSWEGYFREISMYCTYLSQSTKNNPRQNTLTPKMFCMHSITRYIVVCAGMRRHIECPLLDTVFGTVLTKNHIVSSSRLMETQSLYKSFLIHSTSDFEGIVFCWWDDRFSITKIYRMSIRYECIIGSDSHSSERTSIRRKIRTSLDSCVCGWDVG
jgi:hypothetical protein